MERPSGKFRFLFFTDLVGKKVVSSDGESLGRLADLVAVSGEPYPPVESLLVRSGRTLSQIPWSAVASVNGNIELAPGATVEPAPTAPVADRLHLGQEILDRQIVDIEDAKLVRVNDLHFLETKGQLRIAHVDVGLRGLVRRMGWQRPVDGVVSLLRPRARYLNADHLLSWKLVQPLESAPGRVRIEAAQRRWPRSTRPTSPRSWRTSTAHQREVLLQRLDVETAADALEETVHRAGHRAARGGAAGEGRRHPRGDGPRRGRRRALRAARRHPRRAAGQAMERPEAAEVAELLELPPAARPAAS